MLIATLVAVALLLGAFLRVWALDFGLPSWLHPDEYSFVFFPLNFWSGDLNPHFFTYPTLQYYLLSLVYLGYFGLQYAVGNGQSLPEFVAYHYFWNQTDLMLVARALSAAMGVATVGWTALLARSAFGPRAAVVAAFLMAVCPLHVRQSHLAGVDVALTLWFTGAIWASLRLARTSHGRDYLLAGLLVGLAGATKYPGALAAAGVLSAHLMAGRSWRDRRLLAAGGVAIASFILCSPYVLLDFAAFRAYFVAQAVHLGGRGTADVGLGWWYHLHVTLAHGIGWLALLSGSVAGFWLRRHRRLETAVLLASFLGLFLVLGSGQRTFMRYALPLVPLLLVLAAGLLGRLRGRGLAAVVLLASLQPLWSSLRQVQLLGVTDSRVEARAWMEANVPPGTAIANFGGWAGDVDVRTFEQLWWQASLFEQRFGRGRLEEALAYLARLPAGPPYFSYGIQRTNMAAMAGSFAEIERLETPLVVLHRHPLNSSSVDSAFASELAGRARKVFAVKVGSSSGVRFDAADAFYLPVGGAGDLERPGPDIEIWQLADLPLPSRRSFSVRELFSRAYARGITETGRRRGPSEAAALLRRARELDPENPEVYFITAYHAQRADNPTAAIEQYRRSLALQPTGAAARHNLAVLYESLGDADLAAAELAAQLSLAPWKRSAFLALAEFHRRQGEADDAVAVYLQLTTRFPGFSEGFERLGRTYQQLGRTEAAASAFLQALKLEAGRVRTHLLLARLYKSARRIADMVAACRNLLAVDPHNREAHTLLAYGYRQMGQLQPAARHAQAALATAPADSLQAQWQHWLRQTARY